MGFRAEKSSVRYSWAIKSGDPEEPAHSDDHLYRVGKHRWINRGRASFAISNNHATLQLDLWHERYNEPQLKIPNQPSAVVET